MTEARTIDKNHGTAEVCDRHPDAVRVMQSVFLQYGGKARCCGEIETILLDEDNATLKSLLSGPGHSRIAAVQVTGATCAVVGDNLASLALDNGWSGILIDGYVRDSNALARFPLPIWARGTCPMRSQKDCEGKTGEALQIAGIAVKRGDYFYGDNDGIVISAEPFSDILFAV